ncbi:MAG: hypothetical protein KF805_14235 [Phycisphaeraceae bacterium]|nr:hypothetical protein [Phycisphaeraceae bacterium]
MPCESDPTLGLLAALRRRRVAGSVALVAVGAWALWPQQAVPLQSLAAAHVADPKPPADVRWVAPNLARNVEPLNMQAFEARLWTLPPKPVEVAAAPLSPQPPPPAPPPFKLVLVGIFNDEADESDASKLQRDPRAALFDPETSKVHTVPVGASVLRYRVKSITPENVELVDALTPSIPPYTLKMRSGEIKPIVLPQQSRAGQRTVAPPAGEGAGGAGSNKDADLREPPANDLASGGAK